MSSPLDFRIQHEVASQGYDRVTCWAQARSGVIPAGVAGSSPLAVLTMQKLRLEGSDDYETIYSQYSSDSGATWSEPVSQSGLRRREVQHDGPEIIEEVPCDFWPKWHASTGTMLGTGHTACYTDGKILADRKRTTCYATYDPKTHTWSEKRDLDVKGIKKLERSGAGCTQRVDLENGEILLPIYYRNEDMLNSSTVARCAFDGEILEYLEHGTELTVSEPRGLGEPSLASFGGRYYLALRNDQRNYIATSEDGLHYDEPQPWRFDDGEELGSYNTQQHWVTRPDGLFLVYTRRGLNNDHVFRHRAPVVIAQVDTEKLCVIRETERPVIPERGARLGNFGITEAGDNETWVVEAEWMQNNGDWADAMMQKIRERLPEEEVEKIAATPRYCGACEQFGSDNTVWVARLIWD